MDIIHLLQVESLGTIIQTDLSNQLVYVSIDPVLLQQVLLNLIMNAIEAMKPISDHPRVLQLATKRIDQDQILVAVRDSGVGFAPGSATQLFNAFYTTKPKGLGMGLSISLSIVETYGGRLWAESNDGVGATFQFTLPASHCDEK
jgi:C4-dicarboxylate-specific signal transduction histidine kinase